MVCENIFTAQQHPNVLKWSFQLKIRLDYNCLEILNHKGYQNCITGSRVTAILLNWGIFLLDKLVKLVRGGSLINGPTSSSLREGEVLN